MDPWNSKSVKDTSDGSGPRDMLRFIMAGNVDDGKSTLIGRLLYETGSIYDDQLASTKAASSRKGQSLDLSLITDGLRAERDQAITIDVAYRYFGTARRQFIVADTPGHALYTRNMLTGASTADVAIILMDARTGVSAQTRRHTYLAWLLGIRHIILAVNKMDLIDFDETQYSRVYQSYLNAITPLESLQVRCIPISAIGGDNVTKASQRTAWYEGPTLLEWLETIEVAKQTDSSALRFYVQNVIHAEPDFRGYAGQIAGGVVRRGMKVLSLPSEQVTEIRTISLFDTSLEEAAAGRSVVLTTSDHVALGRGEMLTELHDRPAVSQQITATVVWMSSAEGRLNSTYLIKHTTQILRGTLTRLVDKLDIESFERKPSERLEMNDIVTATLSLSHSLVCDSYAANRFSGSFLIIDPFSFDTVGAGMILSTENAPEHPVLEVHTRDSKSRYPGITVWLTGLASSGTITIARLIQKGLNSQGWDTEFLDQESLQETLNRDLGHSEDDLAEEARRLSFLAAFLSLRGTAVIVAATSTCPSSRHQVKQQIDGFFEVFVDAAESVFDSRTPQHGNSQTLNPFYETPPPPNVVCNTARESPVEAASRVLKHISAHAVRPKRH
jgi:bifunctional enzyme CysN/CysC